MAFQITTINTDKNHHITDADWLYTNLDGRTRSGNHKFHTPFGTLSLDQVSNATVVGWLMQQMEIDGDAFEAYFAAHPEEGSRTERSFNADGLAVNLDNDVTTAG